VIEILKLTCHACGRHGVAYQIAGAEFCGPCVDVYAANQAVIDSMISTEIAVRIKQFTPPTAVEEIK